MKRRGLTVEDVDKLLYQIESGVDITYNMIKNLDLKEKGIKSLFNHLQASGYELINGDWVRTKKKVDISGQS